MLGRFGVVAIDVGRATRRRCQLADSICKLVEPARELTRLKARCRGVSRPRETIEPPPRVLSGLPRTSERRGLILPVYAMSTPAADYRNGPTSIANRLRSHSSGKGISPLRPLGPFRRIFCNPLCHCRFSGHKSAVVVMPA
jgi:hypothetical protein